MIDLDKLKTIIYQINQTKNYKSFSESFSFEEKILFCENPGLLIDALEKVLENRANNFADEVISFFFTDEEIKYIFQNFDNFNYMAKLMASASTQDIDLKIKFFESADAEDDMEVVYKTIKDEELRFSLFNRFQSKYSDYEKRRVSELFSDEYKLKILKFITRDWTQAMIIQSLADDNLKIQFLFDNNLRKYFKDIIMSIKNDSIKHKVITEVLTDEQLPPELMSGGNKYEFEYVNALEKKVYFPSINIAEIIASFINDDLKMKFLNKEKPEDYRYLIIGSLRADDLKISLLETITDPKRIEHIINRVEDIQTRFSLLVKYRNFERLQIIINNEPRLDYVSDEVLNFYAEQCNLDFNDVKKLYTTFGVDILKIITHQNIKKIIDLSPEEFQKLLHILNVQKSMVFDKNSLEGICEALIQREFRYQNANVLNTFARINQILNYDINKVLLEIEDINFYLGDEFDLILQKHNIDKKKFIERLTKDINQDVLNILHEITTRYIENKRREYLIQRQSELDKELNLNKVYEKEYLISKLLTVFSNEEVITSINKLDKEKLKPVHLELIKNIELLTKCLAFKRNPQEYNNDDFIEIKNNLKTFNQILSSLDMKKLLDERGLLNYDPEAKYLLDVKPINSDFISSILTELDIDLIKAKLLNDENLFNKLIAVLSKYKFIGWQDTFDNLLKKSDFIFDEVIFCSLIEYFYNYYPELEETDNVNLLSILDNADLYGSMASKYFNLLDKDNYIMYRKNPGTLSGFDTKNERFQKLPDYMKRMYQREYITIPPMDEIITVENKKIKVTVGDTKNLINITLGERADSCVRVGGIGDALFDYCLTDENGFNIRFTDPDTDDLVTKISGFRNGNTIFLNQLCYSLNNYKYSNNDLVDFAKQLATMLIEKTKNAEFPISNVVISKKKAMETSSFDTINIDGIRLKEQYRDFYFDVGVRDILLATSDEEKPIIFGKNNVTKYEVSKIPAINITDGNLIYRNISRIKIIQKLLDGEDFSNIEITDPEAYVKIVKLVVGEDFYIGYDEEDNIIEEFYLSNNNVQKEGGRSF